MKQGRYQFVEAEVTLQRLADGFLSKKLDAASLYLDYKVSKAALARRVNCTRTTIHAYYNICWSLSEDFRLETRQNPKTGEFQTDDPLTTFQTWLITRIMYVNTWHNSHKETTNYVKQNYGLFTIDYYEQASLDLAFSLDPLIVEATLIA